MKFRTPRILAALLVGGLALGVASPALAQTVSTDEADSAAARVDIADVKTRCIQAIDTRLDSLSEAQARLNDASFVTEDHLRELTGIIGSTESGLTGLRSEIDAATDREEIRRLCMLIGPEYRVYLVVIPQVHLTAATDRIDAAGEKIEDLEERFYDAVEKATEAGIDVSEAVSLAEEAMALFDAGINGVDGVADSVLAVTPHSYDEGPGAATLNSAREAVRTSHDQMKSGWETGKAAVQALKDAIAGA